MPSEVKLTQTTIDNAYRLAFIWDLEFDITASDLNFEQATKAISLAST